MKGLTTAGSVVVLQSKEVLAMPTLKIDFDDEDTTPDRLNELSRETGLSPEQLVHRAIALYLGEYGLKPLPEGFKPQLSTPTEI